MRRCVDDFVLLLVIVIEVWPQLADDEFGMSNDEGLRMICCFFGRGVTPVRAVSWRAGDCAPYLLSDMNCGASVSAPNAFGVHRNALQLLAIMGLCGR
jgi:hypothetical protein